MINYFFFWQNTYLFQVILRAFASLFLLTIYLFISGYFPIRKFPFDKVASSSPTWSLNHILWPRWFQVCTFSILKRIIFLFWQEPQNKYLMDESGYFAFEHYLTKVSNPKLMWQKTKIYQHINRAVSLTITMICCKVPSLVTSWAGNSADSGARGRFWCSI